MTIREALMSVYDRLPYNEFNGMFIITRVRRILNKPYMYGDSILRELRRLRQEGIINYSVVSGKKSKFKKNPVW